MLIFMENMEEIFRAWFKKVVVTDKKIHGKKVTGVELSKATGISGVQITWYHSGRVSGGVRKFPTIPLEVMETILKKTKTSQEEMMGVGRKELNPHNGFKEDDQARLKLLEKEVNALKGQLPAKQIEASMSEDKEDDLTLQVRKKNKPHYNVVKKLARSHVSEITYEMNRDLLEIVELSESKHESMEVMGDIHHAIKRCLDKARKKYGKYDDQGEEKNA